MTGDDKSLLQTMVCEKATAMYTASAVGAALFAKGRGSGGQSVVVNMDTVCMHYLMPDVYWGLSWYSNKDGDLFPNSREKRWVEDQEIEEKLTKATGTCRIP